MISLKVKQYLILMRMHKPIGFLLLLWPTLIALYMASNGFPPKKELIIFVLGVIVMRAAGCVINDIADRDFDRHVKRTKYRPLTSGKVSLIEAIVIFMLLMFCAFVLVLQTNLNTILLSFVGAALAATYPFTKRVTHLPQFVLGAAFSWAIPMSYSALEVPFDSVMCVLFLYTVLWSVVYDTMYAMVDESDDLKIGIKSTAILFGEKSKLVIGIMQVILFSFMIHIGYKISANLYYYIFVFISASTFLYQQKLLATNLESNYFKAFLNNNYTGMLFFIGVLLNYYAFH